MKPTREEILAEKPGPRLNVWVAEWVMKWWLNDKGTYWECEGNKNVAANLDNYDVCRWSPSTSMADAWMVVEKIQDLQKTVEFREAWRRETLFDFSQFTAETMSWYICRAALLAVMEE